MDNFMMNKMEDHSFQFMIRRLNIYSNLELNNGKRSDSHKCECFYNDFTYLN